MTDERKLTIQQTETIAKSLYGPTLQRMNTLCGTLIQMTQNGDFALWAPLAVMQDQLSALKWGNATAPERFLNLIATALSRYAALMSDHALALEAARLADAPLPPFQGWTDADSIAVYDEIEARYPVSQQQENADEPAAGPEETR
jgi:hypothetical protein